MAVADRISIDPYGKVSIARDVNGNGVLEWTPLATTALYTFVHDALDEAAAITKWAFVSAPSTIRIDVLVAPTEEDLLFTVYDGVETTFAEVTIPVGETHGEAVFDPASAWGIVLAIDLTEEDTAGDAATAAIVIS